MLPCILTWATIIGLQSESSPVRSTNVLSPRSFLLCSFLDSSHKYLAPGTLIIRQSQHSLQVNPTLSDRQSTVSSVSTAHQPLSFTAFPFLRPPCSRRSLPKSPGNQTLPDRCKGSSSSSTDRVRFPLSSDLVLIFPARLYSSTTQHLLPHSIFLSSRPIRFAQSAYTTHPNPSISMWTSVIHFPSVLLV